MLKWIYVANRNRSTSRAEFIENWKQHAALSESFAEITSTFSRNTQAVNVTDESHTGPDASFDGVCLLDLTSLRAAPTVYSPPGIAQMEKDEARARRPGVLRRLVAESCGALDGGRRVRTQRPPDRAQLCGRPAS